MYSKSAKLSSSKYSDHIQNTYSHLELILYRVACWGFFANGLWDRVGTEMGLNCEARDPHRSARKMAIGISALCSRTISAFFHLAWKAGPLVLVFGCDSLCRSVYLREQLCAMHWSYRIHQHSHQSSCSVPWKRTSPQPSVLMHNCSSGCFLTINSYFLCDHWSSLYLPYTWSL